MDRSGGTRKRAVILVWLLGAGLIAVAVGLNISFIVVNWRTGLLLLVGVISFAVLIGGLVLNTIFLSREIRKSEQHDAFIHAVTHELKTPLASIKLYLQTLQQREFEPDKRRELIDTMLEDSERLQGTIDQILLAGKTGDARRVDNPTEVDVSDIVGECVALAGRRHHLVEGELRLVQDVPPGTYVVNGDREELTAAVTNLVDNAIKYSGQRVLVGVDVARAGARRVAISVRDQGIGITSQELKRVFRRFYRLPAALQSRVRGTGIGLSIVRAVARRHGGRAYAESNGAGKGSTFTLELPLKS
ncbi:MAG: HAMP domain-containing sensor histidine kinase [Acidobacteria bacterium]|nr:HAMP domain-containing sensor histidine kinase [Acidobacteriota bacterium]